VKKVPSPRPYGPQWQEGRREVEKAIREDVVEFLKKAKDAGLGRNATASSLLLSPSTLRAWVDQSPVLDHEWVPRGRPTHASSPDQRDRVFEILKKHGPRTGVEPLQGLFPAMPRREVACLKRQWVRDHRSGLYRLEWTRPGAVWAVDHARPDGIIIGVERALWAVRDLASHNQLVWCLVLNMTAQGVRSHLVDLFLEHGAPLAIKMDNGALATDEDLTEVLNYFGVIRLLSPAYTPPYNGACEASIGWMKIRTRHQASLDGCPEVWTREHCEAARRSANEISRPWGPCHPTPQQAWDARGPVTEDQRAHFLRTLNELRITTQAEIGAQQNLLDRRVQAQIERTAITRTLVACGLLNIRRRSIPLQQ